MREEISKERIWMVWLLFDLLKDGFFFRGWIIIIMGLILEVCETTVVLSFMSRVSSDMIMMMMKKKRGRKCGIIS